jgi:hypothetical protein
LNDLGQLIKHAGAEYFSDIVVRQEEESLHLEFKTLSQEGGVLIKEDKRIIARAIAGFANAEGGVLIIGIATQRLEGRDVAYKRQPIKQLSRTTNLVRAALPEMLSPQHRKLEVFSVLEHDSEDEGFIVVCIPDSDERPFHSNVHHQYFRRGSDGTRVMEHREVRELMLAGRDGKLTLDTRIAPVAMHGGNFYRLRLWLVLKNAGQVPVRAPYLRLAQPGWDAAQHVFPRPSTNGHTGFYTKRDELIHVEDECDIAAIETGLDLTRTGVSNLAQAVAQVKAVGWHTVGMFPFSHLPSSGSAADVPVGASGFFGAENVAANSFDVRIDKKELFRLFCKLHALDLNALSDPPI